MCSTILGISTRYSSFEYCLFNMQYFLFLMAIHPKISEQLYVQSLYLTSLEFDPQAENMFLLPLVRAIVS